MALTVPVDTCNAVFAAHAENFRLFLSALFLIPNSLFCSSTFPLHFIGNPHVFFSVVIVRNRLRLDHYGRFSKPLTAGLL